VELFSANVRYSGASLGVQLASIVGAASPMIAAALLARTGGATWPISVYLIALAVITIVSVVFAAETFRRRIEE
jgi:MHS family shikimate/dehydroshikimate transporter-like MFS transporter